MHIPKTRTRTRLQSQPTNSRVMGYQSKIAAPCVTPSFTGFVEHPEDALLLIAACREGMRPRIRRKLYEADKRRCIVSGSIFVWEEGESHLHRWTDGLGWSASRGTNGNACLVYREMSKRGGGRSRTAAAAEMRRSHRHEFPEEEEFFASMKSLTGSLLNKGEYAQLRKYRKSGPAQERDVFKRGGLIKKTFSLTISEEKWHVVGYYTIEDALTHRLETPRQSALFRSMSIPEDIRDAYDLSRRDGAPPSPSITLETPLSPWDDEVVPGEEMYVAAPVMADDYLEPAACKTIAWDAADYAADYAAPQASETIAWDITGYMDPLAWKTIAWNAVDHMEAVGCKKAAWEAFPLCPAISEFNSTLDQPGVYAENLCF